MVRSSSTALLRSTTADRGYRARRSDTSRYSDPEYRRNRAILLANSPWCVGWPRKIHGDRKVRATTADHRIPLSRGGSHDLANLDPLCADCNGRKAIENEGASGGREGWRRGR